MRSGKHRSTERIKTDEIITVSEENGWDAIKNELAITLTHVFDRIKTELKPQVWNRLYVELWMDSGRYIIYPHRRGTARSTRPFTVQLQSLFLLAEFDRLPDPKKEPNFESYYIALQGHAMECLSLALEAKTTKARIRELRKESDFTIWFQDADDEESLVPFD